MVLFTNWISNKLYTGLLENNALEELEIDRVSDFIAAYADTGFSTLTYFAIAFTPSFVLCANGAQCLINRRLISISAEVDSAANELLEAFRRRQIASFGFLLPGSSLKLSRKKAVRLIQEFITHLLNESRNLCVDSADETSRLYEESLPPETAKFLEADSDNDPMTTSLESIRDLWAFCRMFRSEYFFLLVRKFRVAPMNAFFSSFKMQRQLGQLQANILGIIGSLNQVPARVEIASNVAKIPDTMTLTNIQLRELIHASESGELDEARLAAALRRICSFLEAKSYAQPQEFDQCETEDLGESLTQDSYAYQPHQSQPVDEVFEAVVRREEPSGRSGFEEVDDTVDRASGQIMLRELREILVDRAKEMRTRENRALAAFYNVEPEEIERQATEEEQQSEAEEEQRETADLLPHVPDSEDLRIRRTFELPNLSSELAMAIQKRGGVREEVLENSDCESVDFE
ncbi:unnamed protein product, partial [Mesorhabditis spiculigera]